MHKFVQKEVMEDNPHYDPENLLNILARILRVKNDRELANKLGVQPSQVCKIRKRRAAVSSALLIRMHEDTNISLRHLRALMGDYRDNTGPTAKHPAEPRLDYLCNLRVPVPVLVSLPYLPTHAGVAHN